MEGARPDVSAGPAQSTPTPEWRKAWRKAVEEESAAPNDRAVRPAHPGVGCRPNDIAVESVRRLVSRSHETGGGHSDAQPMPGVYGGY